jgi:hypothetical protein
MSKKPAAALSANLVAVKGLAAPSPDMSGRAASAPVPAPVIGAPVPANLAPEPLSAPTMQVEGGGQPLNFRVPDAFRREFKVYAARNGLKLNELLRLSFEAYRRQNGE